jgi:hypothetical protein
MAAVVLALAGAGAVAVVSLGPRSGGPVAASLHERWQDYFPAPVGQVWTWGIVLPENTTAESLVIEDVAMESVSNIVVGSVIADDPMASGGAGLVEGFPAAGHAGASATGYAVAARGAPGSIVQLLVSVAREGPGVGTIGSVKIRYRSQGVLYEDQLPISLRIVEPGP